MFTDSATITVQGGNGGNGTVAWRRAKYEPNGGPNGGDGGHGGSVYFIATSHADTLSDYSSRKHFQADSGKQGGGQDMHGRNGEDVLLPVPQGTLIYSVNEDGTNTLLADLAAIDDTVLVCKGGRGGFGNAHFVSSVRQAPDFAELGQQGEEKTIHLELQLVADVGIIGYPSVGKSSIIAAISAARPKIAAYEFTTLIPNLGVVTYDNRSFVVCDVPGLIKGASEGKGLGHTFLKHIERCRILVHVLSIERALHAEGTLQKTLLQDYRAIRKELEAYSEKLTTKPEYVFINKVDMIDEKELKKVCTALKKAGVNIWYTGSTFDFETMTAFKKKLLTVVTTAKDEAANVITEPKTTEEVVLRPLDDGTQMRSYIVDVKEDRLVLSGNRIEQLVQMTNFDQVGGMQRLKDVFDRIGITRLVKRHAGKAVYVGDKNVSIVFENIGK